MITEDELKKYLPKYLSEENYNNLLTELKSFPYNIDNRMYTYSLDNNIIYQGDGIKEMPLTSSFAWTDDLKPLMVLGG